GLIVATFYGLVGLAISSLTSRRAFAVGGYLAFLALTTVMGGVITSGLNETHFRLLAVAVSPIRAGQGLFPKYSDPGNISPVVWGSTVVEVCVVAVIVLAVRYGRDEGRARRRSSSPASRAGTGTPSRWPTSRSRPTREWSG